MLSTLTTHLCIFLTHHAGWPLSLLGGDEQSIGAALPAVAGVLLVLIVLHFFRSSSTLYPSPTPTAHTVHARLLSWFLDAPAASFGVHRMALAGKAAGKNVGMFFGPSAAASAIRMLVDAFPAWGLGVSVTADETLYKTELARRARRSPRRIHCSRRERGKERGEGSR
ncbi:hypothetical protein B0H10DRAFT_2218873 [Mycena sp. CBHHK59/15]|nr:hypothetical protein B0H10DRAFT_2218873 [Mycena sp. CBHHK59/15]